MVQLWQLKQGITVKEIFLHSLITFLDIKWFSSVALGLSYRDASGRLGNELVYRTLESDLELFTQDQSWSFSAEGALSRLVSQAHRIRLADLFI